MPRITLAMAKKETKRGKYKITNSMLADWFRLKSERSFNSSSAKDRYINVVERVAEHVEGQIMEKLK